MWINNRKKYFIKKDFQSRFMLRFVAIATFWAVATAILFSYLAGKKLDDVRYSSHIDSKTISELLMPITVATQAASLLIFAGILAYTVSLLWKRLSPPLFSLKKDIARIAGGDLMSEVSLSSDEEFQDLADDLNDMRCGLQQKIVRLREQFQTLSTAADELHRSTIEGKLSLTHAAALHGAVEQMNAAANVFHY
jgi:methyl-accepting chemotaxis protein